MQPITRGYIRHRSWRRRRVGTRNEGGFTLIEIAIVLVIIGLLLGGVLRGQELITSARVRNLVSQQEGIKAAFFGFQDRFRALPGDFASASVALKCPVGANCLNGNGNGVVEDNAAPVVVAGTATEVHEEILAWMHLTTAGFLNGSYAMTAGDVSANDNNNPKSPFNIYLQLLYDANYADVVAPNNKHNLKTGAQVPVEIIAEVDRKVDDGNGARGAFRYSSYAGNAPAAPPPATASYSPGQCMTTAGVWHVPQGERNCGGASLL